MRSFNAKGVHGGPPHLEKAQCGPPKWRVLRANPLPPQSWLGVRSFPAPCLCRSPELRPKTETDRLIPPCRIHVCPVSESSQHFCLPDPHGAEEVQEDCGPAKQVWEVFIHPLLSEQEALGCKVGTIPVFLPEGTHMPILLCCLLLL